MLPVELMRDDTLLIGLQSIDRLETVLSCQIPSLSGTIMCPPIREKTNGDSQEAEKEVNDLIPEECMRVYTTKAIDNRSTDQSAKAIAAVPACNPERLFGAPVEGNGDDREKRNDSGLKGTEEKTEMP